ncbi:MAG: AAA family ATPase [Ilumatobacteraceae bacterium]
MEVERQFVQLCVRGARTRSPHLTESRAAVELADHPSLSDDQRALVGGLLTSERFCDVVVAPAGSGKTFSLNAARQGWEANGHRVIGVSLAARAAKELAAQANIRSSTAAALEGDLRASRNRFDSRTVLVIDEAAMMGTRQMATLLVHAYEAGSKVVLVGDPHQLQSIEAGGLLRGLSDRIDVFELTREPTPAGALGAHGARRSCETATRRSSSRRTGSTSGSRWQPPSSGSESSSSPTGSATPLMGS